MEIESTFRGDDIVTIVLSGAFEAAKPREGWSLTFVDLERQLTRILCDAGGDIPLIKENHYYFDDTGAFLYSEAVQSALWSLKEVNVIRRVIGQPEEIVHSSILAFAREPLKAKTITEENYRALQDLGRKLEVRRPVYI
jgi:hypothetical protein